MRLPRTTPALALIALLAACGERPTSVAGDGSPGAKTFLRLKCDSCHGPDGNGLPRVAPKLERLAENWTREELMQYPVEPAPFRVSKPHLKAKSLQYFAHMSPHPGLSEEERAVLADWLLERFGSR